jgi:hypothetical protein
MANELYLCWAESESKDRSPTSSVRRLTEAKPKYPRPLSPVRAHGRAPGDSKQEEQQDAMYQSRPAAVGGGGHVQIREVEAHPRGHDLQTLMRAQ